MSYYGLFANILPAMGFGLDQGKLPVSFTNMLLVSMGEEEINGPDVRRLGQPLYISPNTCLLQLQS